MHTMWFFTHSHTQTNVVYTPIHPNWPLSKCEHSYRNHVYYLFWTRKKDSCLPLVDEKKWKQLQWFSHLRQHKWRFTWDYMYYIFVWVFSFTIVLHRYFYFVVVTTGRECVCVFFFFLLFRSSPFSFRFSLFTFSHSFNFFALFSP